MQQPVGVVFVEDDIVGIVGIGVNPDGIFPTLEHAAEDCCQRTRSQLCVGYGKHVGLQTAVCHIPVEVFGTPLRIEPFLVQVFWCWWHRDIGVGRHSFLKMLPHIQYDTLMVPPVNIMFLRLFQI